MFNQLLFNLVQRLVFSPWASQYGEYHGACEDTYGARFGPICVEINQCLALEYDDAWLGFRLPTPWGKVQVGYQVCLGAEQVRESGFHYHRWIKPKPRSHPVAPSPDEPFPF